MGLETAAIIGTAISAQQSMEERRARKKQQRQQEQVAVQQQQEQSNLKRKAQKQRRKQIDTMREQVLAPSLTGGRRSLIGTGSELGLRKTLG